LKSINIYESIAERTGGSVYAGVVGPVRSGKSTFIKRFMDLMVLPNMADIYERERVRDELPQSGSGRTITTTEPKFIPPEAAELILDENLKFKVRLVDCVGYMIPGAVGHLEEGLPRMVNTPWHEQKIPFEEAAEIGTRKVISDHSTIGILVTTDGTIGDLSREEYLVAEERVVKELAEQDKPYIIVLNSTEPEGDKAIELAKMLEKKYNVPVLATNCAKMRVDDVENILRHLLYQFPPSEIEFYLPTFLDGLPKDHSIKTAILNDIKDFSLGFENIRDIKDGVVQLADGQILKKVTVREMDLGTGAIAVEMEASDGLFYQVIGEIMGCQIRNDGHFFEVIRDYSQAKKAYEKLASAMVQVETEGYGIVQPELGDMILEEPEIFQQGNKFGVRLKAQAPSLHIIKTSVSTEVAPVVGSESQSEDLINYLLDEFESDPSRIWNTNIFGKSLQEMVTEQMESKLTSVPESIRIKLQKSLQKVSDEGREHMICLVL
jgi:stage IV sporulation protein A